MNTALDHAKAVMRSDQINAGLIEGAILAYSDELKGERDKMDEKIKALEAENLREMKRICELELLALDYECDKFDGFLKSLQLEDSPLPELLEEPKPKRWPWVIGGSVLSAALLLALIWTLNHFFAQ